jgi:hypothetical protein
MEGPMTPYADLVARLRAIASANICDLLNMGDESHEPPEITWGELDDIGRAAQEAADALAALPPPADPSDRNTAAEHYRRGWQAGHAAADPPALVALVRRFKEADARFMSALASGAWLDDAHDDLVAVRDELLAYPLPAAPPVTDTPQGDYRALLQQTAAALWDMQHEPDCWCAYSGGSGPTGHTEACAQARVVNEKLKAAGVQHWPAAPAAPPQEDQ